MGWKFNKRIKIAPGVKVNISKSGVSTTVGGKRASVNVGKKGTFLNTTIPKTGLSYRTKISGHRQADSPPPQNYSPPKHTSLWKVGSVILIIFLLVFALAIWITR